VSPGQAPHVEALKGKEDPNRNQDGYECARCMGQNNVVTRSNYHKCGNYRVQPKLDSPGVRPENDIECKPDPQI